MPGGRLWLVTVTVGGDPLVADDVRAALERLAAEQPFLLSGRYAADYAELRYWEEAETCVDAAALALRVWGEHRTTAQLPPWEVRGLEVLERRVAEARGEPERLIPAPVSGLAPVSPTGSWRPLM
jgi:hypothetical protein